MNTNQMGMGTGSMSQMILNQGILKHIQTDNIFVQTFLSFAVLSLCGYITAKAPVILKYIQTWLFPKTKIQYPTIKLLFTKKENESQMITTNLVSAWLEKIKESFLEYEKQNLNLSAEQLEQNNKYQVKSVKSIATSTSAPPSDYHRVIFNIRSSHKSENHWLPDQKAPFLIDNDIYAELYHKDTQGGSDKNPTSIEQYTLYIYSKKNTLSWLLKYSYEAKLQSIYSKIPHVFFLEGINNNSSSIIWSTNKFSSSRQMRHIWFEEKSSFLAAYKNFLYKKDEYDARGDPYTFSLLMYGPPGCGKTSILKALMNYDLNERRVASHLFVVPFSKIKTNDMFKKVMLDPMVNKTEIAMDRRIYVFEDFDANKQSAVFAIRDSLKGFNKKDVFDGINIDDKKDDQKDDGKDDDKKEEKEDKLVTVLVSALQKTSAPGAANKKSNLNLSDILNTLDGICERTGQRCVWTTNAYPPQNHFDPAFLRPGRMDMIIKLGRCTHEGIRDLVRNYFDIYDNKENDDGDLKTNNDDIDLNGIDERRFTPAEIKQICKEAVTLKNTISMMKKICNLDPSDKKISDVDKLGKLPSKRMKRPGSLPLRFNVPPPITRLHSGHWFSAKQENGFRKVDDMVDDNVITKKIKPKQIQKAFSSQ